MKRKLLRVIFIAVVSVFVFAGHATAQTSLFTYQGQLNDGVAPANGSYDMQFALFDAVSAGTQIGSTVTRLSVSVSNGIFTVQLDFGSSPFSGGANRFLQIGVKKTTDPSYTTLAPREQITSSPYSMRTLSATSSDSLSAACVGCVTDAQINSVSGGKVTGAVSNATTAVNVSGTVPIGNGGTGATNGPAARTNLGLGSLSTVTPTGTANSTTFLRGDNTWSQASSPLYFLSRANRGTSSGAGDSYYLPIGSNLNNPTLANGLLLAPRTCTISRFDAASDVSGYVSRTFTIMVGSSPGSINATASTISFNGSATVGVSTASVTVNAGQFFTIRDSASGANGLTVNFYFAITCN